MRAFLGSMLNRCADLTDWMTRRLDKAADRLRGSSA